MRIFSPFLRQNQISNAQCQRGCSILKTRAVGIRHEQSASDDERGFAKIVAMDAAWNAKYANVSYVALTQDALS